MCPKKKSSAAPTTVYLVRHGTTEYNETFRHQGAVPLPLNDLGLAQGALLTDYFKDIPIDAAYTSPLERARQTLDFIIKGRDIPVIVEPGISEIDFGPFEGRPFRETSVIWPGAIEKFNEHPGTYHFPGSESGPHVYRRVVRTMKKIAADNPGKTVVVTSHGFAIQTWLNYIKGIPAEKMTTQIVDNVAVSKFIFRGPDDITVDYIGDSHHLTEEYRRNYDWDDLAIPLPLFIFRLDCRECEKAKTFLEKHGVRRLERNIIDDPLRKEEFFQFFNRWDGRVNDFFDTETDEYNADQSSYLPRDDAAERLSENPFLVRHPLLVFQDKLIPGFDTGLWEKALNLNSK